jgi:Tol biopolymer transport system component
MVQSAFNLREPRFSPDGRWLAYVSDESGKEEIYAETFPPGGSKWQVSVDGGTNPKWSRDGRELFFLSPDSTMMAVAFQAGARAVELSVPRRLFEVPRGSSDYDVSADGQRFLVRAEIEDRTPLPIDVVINWASEIQR